MDKVLLVSVIALAVALLSMLVNLALVWKISDLKSKLEWLDVTVSDRTGQLHLDDVEISNQLNKLECNTKDAFEKLTNHLTRHDDQIDKLVDGYKALEIIVNKHTKQLEDLGNFAGITTGELRVLEQKIYNSCKPKELPEPEPIARQFEFNRLCERLSVVENKLSKLEQGFDTFKGGLNRILDYHMVEVDRRIRNRMIPVEEVDIRKHKPDRRRKDNYYRKPNKQQVIYDEFADDIMK